MIGSPGGVARTIGLRVRKNAKPGTSEGLAYIIVKMLAVPRREKVKVTLFLANGVPMMGKIIHYDAYSIVIEVEKGGYQAFIYKHAILSIVPVFAVGITSMQNCNVELHSNDLISHCLMKKIPVELYLINGKKMTGTISHYDKYSLVLNSPDRKQNFIFKHGVSTILPSEKVILTAAKLV